MEYWKDIDDAPNYEVSNQGNIRNKKTGRILKPRIDRVGGYERVVLNGRDKYVHRLVASAFFDGDHDGLDVNHIDGNKHNNALPNLEWCSRKQNISHSVSNNLKHTSFVKVVRCKHCKRRYDFEICMDKPDDFYCSYGEY